MDMQEFKNVVSNSYAHFTPLISSPHDSFGFLSHISNETFLTDTNEPLGSWGLLLVTLFIFLLQGISVDETYLPGTLTC